jgi:heat-inducible transcriptional repressor
MDQPVSSSGSGRPGFGGSPLGVRPGVLPPGLDARSAIVLREVVEQYVETGEPVGSRTLSRRLPMTLSPATIRNVMADLTDAGLLSPADRDRSAPVRRRPASVRRAGRGGA